MRQGDRSDIRGKSEVRRLRAEGRNRRKKAKILQESRILLIFAVETTAKLGEVLFIYYERTI